MSCQAFEGLMTELARGMAVEETSRLHALAHAQFCPRCAARLANEQTLTAIFKLAAAETIEAPAHLETALLATFRKRQPAPVLPAAARPFWRAVPAAGWKIAATLVLALLGAGAYRMLHSPQATTSRMPGSQAETTALPAPLLMGSGTVVARPVPVPTEAPVMASAKSTQQKIGLHRPAAPASRAPLEIATDFIALTPSSELANMESGQLVRVLLPRSAMAICGLPVNQELADRLVTAQVLIAQDGVAHAIRFLSDTGPGSIPTGMPPKR